RLVSRYPYGAGVCEPWDRDLRDPAADQLSAGTALPAPDPSVREEDGLFCSATAALAGATSRCTETRPRTRLSAGPLPTPIRWRSPRLLRCTRGDGSPHGSAGGWRRRSYKKR